MSNLEHDLIEAGYTPVPLGPKGIVVWTGWTAPVDDMPGQPYLVDCDCCAGLGYVHDCPDNLCANRYGCVLGGLNVPCPACGGLGLTEGLEQVGS